MSLANLILSGTLFLSPSNPAHLQSNSNTIWFSNQNTIKAKNFGSRGDLLVEAVNKGVVFAEGLKLNKNQSEPQKIIVVSDSNYNALKKCPQAVLSWNSELGLIENTQEISKLYLNCGFDEIAIKENTIPLIEKKILEIEKTLQTQGIQIFKS
jgi:hypothetical protein